MAFLVNVGRIGFAPPLEPLKATFTVGAGTAGLVASLFMAVSAGGPWLVGTLTDGGQGCTQVFRWLAVGLAVWVLGIGVLDAAARTPGRPRG